MKIKGEYITLSQLLKALDLVSSGGEAKARINEFEIIVNNEKDNRRGRKVYRDDTVFINGRKIDFDNEN